MEFDWVGLFFTGDEEGEEGRGWVDGVLLLTAESQRSRRNAEFDGVGLFFTGDEEGEEGRGWADGALFLTAESLRSWRDAEFF